MRLGGEPGEIETLVRTPSAQGFAGRFAPKNIGVLPGKRERRRIEEIDLTGFCEKGYSRSVN
ncbi:hypothetical protein HMPREF0262_03129 [Clostridium sp. ATCC 29733]|nr:hypothetical protein HMPREF0262_03129 [Clostridium sp. ATCC 29733]